MPAFETIGPNGEVHLWPSRKKCHQLAPRLELANRYRRRGILAKLRRDAAQLNAKIHEAELKAKPQTKHRSWWTRLKAWLKEAYAAVVGT